MSASGGIFEVDPLCQTIRLEEVVGQDITRADQARWARRSAATIGHDYGHRITEVRSRASSDAQSATTEQVVLDGQFGAPHNGPNRATRLHQLRELFAAWGRSAAATLGLNAVGSYYPDLDEPSGRKTTPS